MKKQIWKFFIDSTNVTIKMPKGSEILTAQANGNKACIWALVNPKNENEERCFESYGTGHDIPYDIATERKYIGTFQLRDGFLVYHLFERTNF